MGFLKEPTRLEDGSVDPEFLKEWYSWDSSEKSKWNIWIADLPEKKKDPTEIIIKKDQLDVGKIIDYKGEVQKKFEFRPTKWDEFIGQAKAKKQAQTIKKIWDRGLKAHFLVDGIKGHGKTTYVELVAKDMDAHLIERVGKQLSPEDIVNIVNEINTSKKEVVMLFIDELDSADPHLLKMLNTIIESFKTGGKNIKPFIFVGATINKHVLIENNPDTLDRIPTHIKFVRYNDEDLEKILKQYTKQLFPKDNIPDSVFTELSKNCKYNPRTGISLLTNYLVEANVDEMLHSVGIVKDGLTVTDIKILRALEESSKPMGANSLALRCGLAEKEYTTEIEPYLLEFGYVNRVPSRVITDKGRKFLEEIK